MYYQDYRKNLQNILDSIKSDQDSLNLGAIAIMSVLDMAMLPEAGDEDDEDTDSDQSDENESDDASDEEDDESFDTGQQRLPELADSTAVNPVKAKSIEPDNDEKPSTTVETSEPYKSEPDESDESEAKDAPEAEISAFNEGEDDAADDKPESPKKPAKAPNKQGTKESAETAKKDTPSSIKKASVSKPQKVQTIEEEYGVSPYNKAAIVVRDVAGAQLMDANTNERLGRFNEEQYRIFSLGNGSLIEVSEVERGARYVRMLHYVDEPEENGVFKFGVVKRNGQSLYVDSSASGSWLRDVNPVLETFYVPFVCNSLTNGNGFVKEGDIVDLAWHETTPSEIKIRWVYKTDTKRPSTPAIVNASIATASIANKALSRESKAKAKEMEGKGSLATIDFNLKGKKVAVVIGNEVRSTLIKKMISAHNGSGKVIDAFKYSNVNKYWRKELRHVDIVVMVQNLNTHATSKTMQKYVKQFNLGFAIADSAGVLSIERAVYRAFKGLPAYETSTQPIIYPIAKA